MSNIKFVSHESFPEDQYTLEIVYLCIDDKYRVGYVRKQAKNGGKFWSVMNAGVTKNGKKEYFPAVMFDSNFLEKDILRYLEERRWTKEKKSIDEDIPF